MNFTREQSNAFYEKFRFRVDSDATQTFYYTNEYEYAYEDGEFLETTDVFIDIFNTDIEGWDPFIRTDLSEFTIAPVFMKIALEENFDAERIYNRLEEEEINFEVAE